MQVSCGHFLMRALCAPIHKDFSPKAVKDRNSLSYPGKFYRAVTAHPPCLAWDKCWVFFCSPDFIDTACCEELLEPWGLNQYVWVGHLVRTRLIQPLRRTPILRANVTGQIQTTGTECYLTPPRLPLCIRICLLV